MADNQFNYPKPGEIVYLNFSPSAGREIFKRRPAVILSHPVLMETSKFAWVVPISHGDYDGFNYPLHVDLDERTKISGTVYVEQLKSMDFVAREWQFVEELPDDLFHEILNKCKKVLSPFDPMPKNMPPNEHQHDKPATPKRKSTALPKPQKKSTSTD